MSAEQERYDAIQDLAESLRYERAWYGANQFDYMGKRNPWHSPRWRQGFDEALTFVEGFLAGAAIDLEWVDPEPQVLRQS